MGVFSSLASQIIGVQSALGGSGGGLRWLLRDEFVTDRAAGAVNGTAAEPGPGTRTVVDTESKLSITGGAAVFAGGKASPAHGDPGFWYGAQTRVAGRMVLAPVSVGAAANMYVGWSGGQSGAINKEYINFNSSPALRVSATLVVGAYSLSTTYQTAVVLRAAGALTFVKGGAFTNWTLLWRSQSDTTATVYPGVSNYDSNYALSFVRVPVALWLPSPIVSDGFGSAYGTSDGLGHAEGIAGGIGAGGSGVTWSNAGGTWSVSGGKAVNTPTPGVTEKLTNGGFETFTLGLADSWTKSGTPTMTQEATVIHGGSSSQKQESTTTGHGIYQYPATLNNAWYRGSVWVYVASGTISIGFNGGVSTLPTNATAASWVLKEGVARGGATNSGIYLLQTGATATTAYLDDASAKLLTLSELLSLTNAACADVMVGAAMTRSVTTFPVGLALNWDSPTTPANGVLVYAANGNIYVDKCVGGTWSLVSTTAYTYSAGARLVVAKNGTEYRVYYNNALVKADTIADAGILTGTYHGLFSTDASNTLDDLTIYATGTDGEYAALDAWSS